MRPAATPSAGSAATAPPRSHRGAVRRRPRPGTPAAPPACTWPIREENGRATGVTGRPARYWSMAAAASLPSATLRTTRPLPRIALPAANTPGRFVSKVPGSVSMPRGPACRPQRWPRALSRRAAGHQHGVEALAQFVQRHVRRRPACPAAARRPAAGSAPTSASSVSHGQVLGRTRGAAGRPAGVRVAERHGVAVAPQMEGGGQARRPGADDRHALAAVRPAGGQVGIAGGQVRIGHVPLQLADLDRPVRRVAAAALLARLRADAAQDGRQGDVVA